MSHQGGDQDEPGPSACDEVIATYLEAEAKGLAPSRQALLEKHPELATELEEFLGRHEQLSELSSWWRAAIGEVSSASSSLETVAYEYRGSQPPPQLPGYEIMHEIARGGMGVIYKARQSSLSRNVAVKMILQGQLASESDRRRFLNEAAAAAKLKHPHIVVIHEVGEHAGQPFFSMEYVDGESLSSIIRRGLPPSRTAARIVKQAAQAVQFAHDHGVLHRDIKPSNVLIDESGAARVMDFGLAKDFAVEGQFDEKLTLTGQMLGTPAYMAPEQISGPREAIGPACDVYGLGALLYELITGKSPFGGANAIQTLLQSLESDPVLPRLLSPSVPRELETITLKCLEKNPENRYPTAQAMADDLERYLEGDSISASSPNLIDRMVRTLERSQYDREFHAWSRMLFYIAAIALVTHLWVFANHALDLPHPLAMQVAARLFEVSGMIAVLWSLRRDWYPPRGAPARQLWAVWLGYMVGSQALMAINYSLTPPGADFNELAVYPPMAVLASLAFIVLGSSYWGYCYMFGGLFLVLALAMPARLAVSPLAFGVSWAASLATLAVRLGKLKSKP